MASWFLVGRLNVPAGGIRFLPTPALTFRWQVVACPEKVVASATDGADIMNQQHEPQQRRRGEKVIVRASRPCSTAIEPPYYREKPLTVGYLSFQRCLLGCLMLLSTSPSRFLMALFIHPILPGRKGTSDTGGLRPMHIKRWRQSGDKATRPLRLRIRSHSEFQKWPPQASKTHSAVFCPALSLLFRPFYVNRKCTLMRRISRKSKPDYKAF